MSQREIRTKIPVSAYEEIDAMAREMRVPIGTVTEACIHAALKVPQVELVSEIRNTEHLRAARMAKGKQSFNRFGKL